MKRSVLFIFTVVLSMFFAYNVFAQDMSSPPFDEGESLVMMEGDMDPMMGDLVAQNMDKGPAEGGFPGMGRGPMMGNGPMMGRGPMGPRAMGARGPMFMPPDLAEKIGLSEEQKTKLDDIITNHRKDMIRKNADISLAEIDLNKLMSQDNPDMNLVKENILKIATMKADTEFTKFKAMIDAKNVLTKEQQEKFKQLQIEHREQMKEKAKERNEKGQASPRPNMEGRSGLQGRQGMENRPK
jgi:Spy/CpxP family protein refolding chaperone